MEDTGDNGKLFEEEVHDEEEAQEDDFDPTNDSEAVEPTVEDPEREKGAARIELIQASFREKNYQRSTQRWFLVAVSVAYLYAAKSLYELMETSAGSARWVFWGALLVFIGFAVWTIRWAEIRYRKSKKIHSDLTKMIENSFDDVSNIPDALLPPKKAIGKKELRSQFWNGRGVYYFGFGIALVISLSILGVGFAHASNRDQESISDVIVREVEVLKETQGTRESQRRIIANQKKMLTTIERLEEKSQTMEENIEVVNKEFNGFLERLYGADAGVNPSEEQSDRSENSEKTD